MSFFLTLSLPRLSEIDKLNPETKNNTVKIIDINLTSNLVNFFILIVPHIHFLVLVGCHMMLDT